MLMFFKQFMISKLLFTVFENESLSNKAIKILVYFGEW